MTLTFGSLFAGIGGFDLGFERAGLQCKFQVEIDDYATKVLEKHWPDVPRWRDVRTFPPRSYECSYSWRGFPTGPFAPDVKRETTRERWGVDVICGGFPCQDISNAGGRAGIEGERSGLWSEYVRIIRVLRPKYVVVENVAALLVRGIDVVLGDLATLWYDAEWHCVPAAAVGAPHIRDRVFILANTNCARLPQRQGKDAGGTGAVCRSKPTGSCQWDAEPNVGRVAHGVSSRVDRIKCLGNAVVPQVAEWLAHRILEAHEQAA